MEKGRHAAVVIWAPWPERCPGAQCEAVGYPPVARAITSMESAALPIARSWMLE